MDKVSKVYFDPLLNRELQVEAFLKKLPVGSAHPWNGTLLLHSADQNITKIDISKHGEEYFSNTVSLAELGEEILNRMKLFLELSEFNNQYAIQQAPSPTFKIPIVKGKIHIFAVSTLNPTYYDLCVGDAEFNTCCYCHRSTFQGLHHSGDLKAGQVLLQHIKITELLQHNKPRCIFVSGYMNTKLTKYKAGNPVVMVVDHHQKTLYTIPVPLDAASIGLAQLCSPLVIKKDGTDNTLICSILATPSTDDDLMCSGVTLPSPSFKIAIERAKFTLPEQEITSNTLISIPVVDTIVSPLKTSAHMLSGKTLVLATQSASIPDLGKTENERQIIRFGKGINWMADEKPAENSSIVLPCVLGGVLEGPFLLATGQSPSNISFTTVNDLHYCYQQANAVVVVVDEKMTDSARNLATSWRINGVFIIQKDGRIPEASTDLSILDTANINAITALAGPQSLVLVQLENKYYFYRGIANPVALNTSALKFGQEVTEIVNGVDITKLIFAKAPRLVDISVANHLYLPNSSQELDLDAFKEIFEKATFEQILAYKDDILMVVPQLQTLLTQAMLKEFCAAVISIVNGKIDQIVGKSRREYSHFVTKVYDPEDPASRKKKGDLLGSYRRLSKEAHSRVNWLTDALGNVISTQTTSTRSHDLKRLIRQNAISSNLQAVKDMNFEKLADMLEEHASEMGVLITNVHTSKYQSYLKNASIDANKTFEDTRVGRSVCDLDSRTLYLEGLDAGIVLEQSQEEHDGPLKSLSGPQQPILAMPYLNKSNGTGSMLAWVCWDEFVDLEDPYTVRWMEKCNDTHIAALRIIMRTTLATAVSSRELSMTSASPLTGQLMGSLLMSAMFKLGSTKTSKPSETLIKAEDTSMRLMRGLFGHLLTMAGSGIQPISFVWQLFSKYPQFDVPTTVASWTWYESTVQLFPYTGWPVKQFKENVTSLLDKVFFRMITKNEIGTAASIARPKSLAHYLKVRNIQLEHMRTVIFILENMLHQQNCQVAAKRLLHMIPDHLENETNSYIRMRFYLDHLAKGGDHRQADNLIAANVITRRSAMFRDEKKALAIAAQAKNKDDIKAACLNILQTRGEVEKTWGLPEGSVHVQCMENIQNLLTASLSDDAINLESNLVARATGDVEVNRIPWHVGQGDHTEDIDENLVKKVLQGGSESDPLQGLDTAVPTVTEATVTEEVKDQYERFIGDVNSDFLLKVQFASSVEDVCSALGITKGAFLAFQDLLAPGFPIDQLQENFRAAVLATLKERNRDKHQPTKQLFSLAAIESN